ncbi:hypothetical protein MRB53_006462 [Persea americana]|uniref:Uncharacterized protein n=1 Tax=Persea americana TaxID=3435 RepID=A0ACC2MH84_PERAE|nr:hypothetical protein MRB53_006462 [Persea americana]
MASPKSVACHIEPYVHAVYYCHETSDTTAYVVPLVGKDKVKVDAVAVCHKDTSQWNPKHIAFLKLKRVSISGEMRIATIFFNLLFIQIESGIQQRATQIAADFVRRIAVNFFTAIAATPETGTENKSFGLPSHRRRQPDCFDRLPSFLASRKPTCHVACRRRSRRLSSCKTLHLSIGCKTRFYYRTKSRKISDTMAFKATAAGIKFEIQKFDGKINFGLWQKRMKNILIQQGIKVALLGKEKKPEKMNADEWADVDERAMSSIEQYLSDEVMFNVMEEKSAKYL